MPFLLMVTGAIYIFSDGVWSKAPGVGAPGPGRLKGATVAQAIIRGTALVGHLHPAARVSAAALRLALPVALKHLIGIYGAVAVLSFIQDIGGGYKGPANQLLEYWGATFTQNVAWGPDTSYRTKEEAIRSGEGTLVGWLGPAEPETVNYSPQGEWWSTVQGQIYGIRGESGIRRTPGTVQPGVTFGPWAPPAARPPIAPPGVVRPIPRPSPPPITVVALPRGAIPLNDGTAVVRPLRRPVPTVVHRVGLGNLAGAGTASVPPEVEVKVRTTSKGFGTRVKRTLDGISELRDLWKGVAPWICVNGVNAKDAAAVVAAFATGDFRNVKIDWRGIVYGAVMAQVQDLLIAATASAINNQSVVENVVGGPTGVVSSNTRQLIGAMRREWGLAGLPAGRTRGESLNQHAERISRQWEAMADVAARKVLGLELSRKELECLGGE